MNELRFYILNEQKQCLYDNGLGGVGVVANGIVKPDGTSAALKRSPRKWQDTLIKYTRNVKYLGMTRSMTVPLEFVEDGALIIKNVLWTGGIDKVLYLACSKRNGTKYPEIYEHFATLELDLSSHSQKLDAITVKAVEGGWSKFLAANEDTVYDLPINPGPYKTLYFTGLPFTNKVDYTIYPDQDIDDNAYYLGNGITSQEGRTQGVVFQDEGYDLTQSIPNNFWFEKSFTKTITNFVEGTIAFTVNLASAVVIRFVKVTVVPGGYNTVDYFLPITSGSLAPGDYSFNYTRIIPMAPGEQLYLIDDGNPGGGSIAFHTIKKSSFSIKYDVTFDPTNVQGLLPKQVLELLRDRIAPGYAVRSTFLDSINDQYFHTSGESLRKFDATSVFQTSFTDFFKTYMRKGLRLGIEGDTLVLEHYDYFFRTDAPIIDIGEIADYELYPADELMGNTYKFGNPEVDTGKENARDEFNVTTHFSGPGKRVVRELDFSSPYQMGMYAIEVARINFFGRDTTDSQVDKTPYLINVSKGANYQYYSGPFTVISATQINVPIRLNVPILDTDSVTIAGTGTDGTFIITSGNFFTDSTVLGFVGGGWTPGSYTGVLTLNAPTTYIINRPVFDSVAGLLHPNEAFNILLSPKRNLLENGPFLRSINDFSDFLSLEFTAGDRNSELITIVAGVTVSEKANEPIGGLGRQLFKPYFLKCRTAGSDFFNDTMQNNPYVYVAFKIKGVQQKGYIWDGGVDPATNGEQTWQFLLAPDTDMSKFIKL